MFLACLPGTLAAGIPSLHELDTPALDKRDCSNNCSKVTVTSYTNSSRSEGEDCIFYSLLTYSIVDEPTCLWRTINGGSYVETPMRKQRFL